MLEYILILSHVEVHLLHFSIAVIIFHPLAENSALKILLARLIYGSKLSTMTYNVYFSVNIL